MPFPLRLAILGSTGSIGHKGMLYAAKAMARTGAALVSDPALLEQARAEFMDVTDGHAYHTPLPEGLQPPLPRR